MCTVVEETNINAIPVVMNTTELVVETRPEKFGRALHRYRKRHEFKSVKGLNVFFMWASGYEAA